jgi:hypothetical protein
MNQAIEQAIIDHTNNVWEQGLKVGITDERERIIKLLEERYAENVDHCEWGTHLFLDNAIELIKGETK